MVAICNSYLCKLYISLDLHYLCTRIVGLSLIQQTKAAHLYNRKKPIITEEIWHIGLWITLSYLF